jgi:ABC-type dipeptide/oligopeptide/nickel transport system ATPase component
VALVGESGSGKSTVARASLGLLPPRIARIEAGSLLIAGREMAAATEREWEQMRGYPAAMVFQDPLSYLNPVMRVGKQIAESVRRHDPANRDVAGRVAELLDLVRLRESVIRAYPHELSGGMRQRVLLAIALGCRPKLLIADEPTTALDVTTQAEILALLRDLRQRLGMAMLLISHDLGVVWEESERVYVMFRSRIVEQGSTREVFSRPGHPYTAGLIQAAKAARNSDGRFATIEGEFSTAVD